jgi:hypothetical protein
LQVPGSGYDSPAYMCASYFVALCLYGGSSFSSYGACHTTSEDKPGVGGVNNSVGVHFGYVTFDEGKDRIGDLCFHKKGSRQQAFFGIAAETVLVDSFLPAIFTI